MDIVRSLQPRDPAAAARGVAALAAVSTVVTVLFALASPPAGAAARAQGWGAAAVLVTIVVLFLRLPVRWSARIMLIVPLGGVVGDAALSVAGHDASAAAQVSLTLPVLFAASQLRTLGAGLVVVAAVVAEAVITHPLPPETSARDAAYVTAAVVSTSALLIRAGQRQDRLVARLHAVAATDVLTQLRTRRSFEDAATAALIEVPLEGVALLLVDVDAFKAVNDTWGHPVGDDALVHISSCLRSVIGAGAVLGRLGGDEFAAVIPGCTAAQARALATAMTGAVAAAPLVLAGGQHLLLSVSVGACHVAAAGADLREVYAEADVDLYRAKHAGLPAPSPADARQTSTARRRTRDGAPSGVS